MFTFDHNLNSPNYIFKKCACAILKKHRHKVLNILREKNRSKTKKASWVVLKQVLCCLVSLQTNFIVIIS